MKFEKSSPWNVPCAIESVLLHGFDTKDRETRRTQTWNVCRRDQRHEVQDLFFFLFFSFFFFSVLSDTLDNLDDHVAWVFGDASSSWGLFISYKKKKKTLGHSGETFTQSDRSVTGLWFYTYRLEESIEEDTTTIVRDCEPNFFL